MAPALRNTIALILYSLVSLAHAALPNPMYGVNIGSWLLMTPWMLPAEWLAMGGEKCADCSTCIGSESALAEAYPDKAEEIFNKHWSSWFTRDHANELAEVGINTARIPLGWWIVEPLVNRSTEFYPRTGLAQLRRGLRDLEQANISVILDLQAAPGVQAPKASFAGKCTSDVQFYTPYNYGRALIWAAVMTSLSHIDPAFSSVKAIHAVNEPLSDASQTPGYANFMADFVQVMRAVERILESTSHLATKNNSCHTDLSERFKYGLEKTSNVTSVSDSVASALAASIPILVGLFVEEGLLECTSQQVEPLVANFMDITWQHNNPANPADAEDGPAGYDAHRFYSFGGVTNGTEEAYLTDICNLNKIEIDIAARNTPLWFGEWALSTQFNATDEFLFKWADAQKWMYSKSTGWIFWNFRVEISDATNGTDLARQWSYLEGVKRGYFTLDPSEISDPNVCDDYIL